MKRLIKFRKKTKLTDGFKVLHIRIPDIKFSQKYLIPAKKKKIHSHLLAGMILMLGLVKKIVILTEILKRMMFLLS